MQHRCTMCGAAWIGAHVCEGMRGVVAVPRKRAVLFTGADMAKQLDTARRLLHRAFRTTLDADSAAQLRREVEEFLG